MKITSRGRYAVLAMVDIAKFGSNRPCSLSHVSVRQNISLSYLEQIFNDLKKAKLVRSQKGPGGGYSLSKKSGEIRILDIFNAIDEQIKTTGCGNNPNAFCSGTNKKCLTHNFWENLEGVIGSYLGTVYLSDLVEGKHN
ncbi:MAG: [Fe-S]-binding protein [Rickettsiales bacterium]|nr:[Fe-S]-binding protein [Rickettsiales bacterium]|tara:strand:- start:895 stop:1311 length:417 start_codon:yes stop_codon:yes gene_type:complete